MSIKVRAKAGFIIKAQERAHEIGIRELFLLVGALGKIPAS